MQNYPNPEDIYERLPDGRLVGLCLMIFQTLVLRHIDYSILQSLHFSY